jgi:hypothetical protein
VVSVLHISATGLREEKFGEGSYVGSAVSNWCQISGCEPDRSDRNIIIGNDIRETTAEAVDLKEGITGGVVADNTFDGSGLKGDADSWVDVKGNGWLIQANHGRTAERSGFQVNHQADGWGRNNLFDGNIADVGGGSGYGFELRPTASAATEAPYEHPDERDRGTGSGCGYTALQQAGLAQPAGQPGAVGSAHPRPPAPIC